MADKEKYMIKVGGKLVEVTPDVYYVYFRMERQERWQEEKQQGHAVVSYDALDDEEKKAIDNIPDAGNLYTGLYQQESCEEYGPASHVPDSE